MTHEKYFIYEIYRYILKNQYLGSGNSFYFLKQFFLILSVVQNKTTQNNRKSIALEGYFCSFK